MNSERLRIVGGEAMFDSEKAFPKGELSSELFTSQGGHRIDLRRSASWNKTGDQRD